MESVEEHSMATSVNKVSELLIKKSAVKPMLYTRTIGDCGMNPHLYDPAFWSRFQFAFTLTYHYLFPQLTMGLAWFLVYWKWRGWKTGDEKYNQAVLFWAKIFGLNFAVGVVTGIPMEFQ
jgi:Cytochrome bd terminal oxidase subunit I